MPNRAQRRKQEPILKKEKAEKISLTPFEFNMKIVSACKQGYDRGFEAGRKTGSDEGVRISMGIMLMGLLDGGHIEKDNITKAWQDVIYKADSVKKKYTTPEEIYAVLRDEYEVDV